MPTATFRHQARAAADATSVWERLQNPATWGDVAGIDSTSDHVFDGDHLTGFRFTATVAAVPYRGTARVTESTPGRSMSLSIRSSELHGTITVHLSGAGDATDLAVTMTMQPAGFVGPVVFPLVTRAVENGFASSVERLAGSMG